MAAGKVSPWPTFPLPKDDEKVCQQLMVAPRELCDSVMEQERTVQLPFNSLLDQTLNRYRPVGCQCGCLLTQPDDCLGCSRVRPLLCLGQNLVPEDIPGKPQVVIRFILHPRGSRRQQVFLDLPPPQAEHRPNQADPLCKLPALLHTRQTGDARPPQDTMQDRLSLIVKGVPGCHMPSTMGIGEF